MGFAVKLKSSSKVTHCFGACWRRGARAGGREEGGTVGKDGAGFKEGGGPNRDMVLCSWGAGVGIRGWAKEGVVH